MTTAEKYRQLEKSPVINIARFIFNDLKGEATNTTLENVIAEIKTGKTPSKQQKRYYEDEYFDWFKPDEIGSEKYLYKSKDKVSKYAFETKQATIYEPDTILINAIGDVGRISILKKQASSNQQITGIRLNSKVYVDYAYFYLLAHREYFYVDLFQTTLPIVNQKKINTIPFCYPIIEEQKRIVKGLEEIEKIKTIDDLQIIDNLNWKEEYKSICRNFFNLQFGTKKIVNELTHQLDLIKQLRQAFLREAMQGKLVKSINTEKTGHQLLEKIKAEKAQLISDKKLKKEKELAPVTEDEIPFEIPEHWAWCRLGEIISYTENLDIHKKLSSETIINYVDIASIDNKNYLIKEVKKSTVEELSTRARRVLKKDYIIYSTVRPYLKNIAIIENELPNFIGSTGFNVFKPINSNIKYLFYFLLSPDLNKKYEETMVGFNSPSITNEQFENTLFPLPPLYEQEQIVDKLEEVMAYCDGLEQSIKESQGYNEILLQQVLREALQGNTVVNE
jgi:type I restriction enzyme S subunit